MLKVDGYDQVADLLGSGYHVAHQTDRAADGSGVSIASRWPIGEVQELDLRLTSRTANLPYGVLLAEVLTPEEVGTLLVVNQRTAFPFGGEHDRELQAVLVGLITRSSLARRRLLLTYFVPTHSAL